MPGVAQEKSLRGLQGRPICVMKHVLLKAAATSQKFLVFRGFQAGDINCEVCMAKVSVAAAPSVPCDSQAYSIYSGIVIFCEELLASFTEHVISWLYKTELSMLLQSLAWWCSSIIPV